MWDEGQYGKLLREAGPSNACIRMHAPRIEQPLCDVGPGLLLGCIAEGGKWVSLCVSMQPKLAINRLPFPPCRAASSCSARRASSASACSRLAMSPLRLLRWSAKLMARRRLLGLPVDMWGVESS